MSDVSPMLALVFFCVSFYVMPFAVLAFFIGALFYRRIWFAIPVGFCGAIVGYFVGVYLGQGFASGESWGWGGVAVGVTALGFAESGYFLGFAGALLVKGMYEEAGSFVFFGLITPILGIAFWVFH